MSTVMNKIILFISFRFFMSCSLKLPYWIIRFSMVEFAMDSASYGALTLCRVGLPYTCRANKKTESRALCFERPCYRAHTGCWTSSPPRLTFVEHFGRFYTGPISGLERVKYVTKVYNKTRNVSIGHGCPHLCATQYFHIFIKSRAITLPILT